MTPPREIEFKLEVPEQALARLTRSPLLRKARNGTQRLASLVSTYYDSDTRKLRTHGLTLRVRRIGRRYVQTVKREDGASYALMTAANGSTTVPGENQASRCSGAPASNQF